MRNFSYPINLIIVRRIHDDVEAPVHDFQCLLRGQEPLAHERLQHDGLEGESGCRDTAGDVIHGRLQRGWSGKRMKAGSPVSRGRSAPVGRTPPTGTTVARLAFSAPG